MARRAVALAAPLAVLSAAPAGAGEADVVSAQVRCDAERVCAFAVAVRHADEGWQHYADRYEVLGPGGEILATRELRHPHVDEQPFTRGLEGVHIPAGVSAVRLRAHDSQHGFGGHELEVAIEVPAAAPR
jgi:hypothetical protein